MTYLSICSGIEAASAAWKPLGFTPAGFAETAREKSLIFLRKESVEKLRYV